MKKQKIVVGLSGGVDSSVAAYLLKKANYEVIGVYMRNWDPLINNDILGKKDDLICPEEQDWQDAQIVAKQLGIKVYRENFVKEYWNDVFTNLISEYKNGHTPNPDILCNRYIKFGAFINLVRQKYNVNFVATGHYAKLNEGFLQCAVDKNKDQTYFLAQVRTEQFQNILFPLGEYTKKQVRDIAQKLNLITAKKKDSTGICFIGERNFNQFLQNYIPAQPGDIIDVENNQKKGKHIGVMYYTIGQRKGLNLGGMTEPHYVVGHNLKKRIIYVASQNKPEYLISTQCTLKEINWINPKLLTKTGLTAKFRYRQDDVSISISYINKQYFINYPQGVSAVTPGQQCVIYYKNFCLGGGVIDQVFVNNKVIPYLK